MVTLVDRLNEALGDRPIYCLTDHDNLRLLSQPDYRAAFWVSIKPITSNSVRLECIGPTRYMPWSGASVGSETNSVEDAVQKTLALIEYSEGWTDKERIELWRTDL